MCPIFKSRPSPFNAYRTQREGEVTLSDVRSGIGDWILILGGNIVAVVPDAEFRNSFAPANREAREYLERVTDDIEWMEDEALNKEVDDGEDENGVRLGVEGAREEK